MKNVSPITKKRPATATIMDLRDSLAEALTMCDYKVDKCSKRPDVLIVDNLKIEVLQDTSAASIALQRCSFDTDIDAYFVVSKTKRNNLKVKLSFCSAAELAAAMQKKSSTQTAVVSKKVFSHRNIYKASGKQWLADWVQEKRSKRECMRAA
jgi:hypothetical protein